MAAPMTNTLPPHDPETDPSLRVSHLDFPVVGIGTSAGGLAALGRFFSGMPAEPGMAFVVVMHLSPRHDSVADRILQRSTGMRVVQVVEPTPLRKNEVYVISPRKGLSMTDGYLRLVDLKKSHGQHVAIDYFFRTLAEVHRERALAVVLTGTGADGSVGIARIRERGGITFAQHPDDAEYDQMPRAAIATGAVDIVLPVAELPDRILTLARNASTIPLPDEGESGDDAEGKSLPIGSVDEDAFRDVMSILRAKTGHDFRAYKRATVLRRIERRLQVNGLRTLEEYRHFLHDHPHERPALLKDMLISVTNFFRDREAFESLERNVLPHLFENLAESDRVRAWSAGCATGEEAYSLAMLLTEAAPPEVAVQVFATDIDDDAIAYARQGSYPAAVATDISPGRLSRFLTRDDNFYQVPKPLREKVLFARHNVLQDPPFSRLDLICCRNLLIYLNRDIQAHVLEMFHFALRPGGYLFLGSSESADVASRFFTPVDKKNRIYRAQPERATGLYLRSSPGGRTALTAQATTAPVAQERRLPSLGDIHRKAMDEHAPPSVLVDRDGHIAHMSESAGPYLRMAGGAPSYQLVSLIVPELRLELRTSLFQASQERKPVQSRAVALDRGDTSLSVTIEVWPVRNQESDAGYQLVIFREGPAPEAATSETQQEQVPLLLQLEEELKRAKEQLQATMEESESSSEELRASNEELQSINEELRSATEELETSKEELQSINEELITVNHELKLKVEETAKVNDDLQNLVASTDIATVFVDRDMCIKRFTPRAADVFRLISADVGRSLLDLSHSLDYPNLAADAESAFQALRSIEREVGSQDGRWYIARILPYRTAEDRIEGAVLTFIDITRRRGAEEAARSSDERMRLVADSATDYAIITTDRDGCITSWSKGAERIFGYQASEVIGRDGDIIFTPEDRARGAFRLEMEQARRDGRAHDDRWHIRADGRHIFCSGITTPLQHGEFHGFAKIARDVTLDKEREREREDLLRAEKASRQQAQNAIEMKDEYLAVMSHELKHPLNLILMNAELVARAAATNDDPLLRRSAEAIRKTVEGQAQIIDDLLDLSRLNTGKLTLNLSPVNVSECIRRVAHGMSQDLSRRGITLEMELLTDDVVLLADTIRIEQVIWNLLSNATKFSREGGHVRLVLERDDEEASLSVTDDGVGMTPEVVERAFDMFEQGLNRRSHASAGLGIGLALVRQLVELHGGSVAAHSDGPDKGASFMVRLPLHDVDGVSPSPSENGFQGRKLDRRRIVLVDDSAELLGPFTELLTMEGAEVSAVQTGQEALDILATGNYDTLLSDLGMPGMDGIELIKRVRANENAANVTALALTGFGRMQDERKALEAGFDAHLSKPVSMSALLFVLASVTRKKKARGKGKPTASKPQKPA
ncbi:CheR family methyltransferase [Luteibacter sp. NPDC031894]|uniref:CheR family methyltransferase n=1 Tax=Luteibacter sp. NPDC031894 TaxID=3390572 RepID=UPI003D04E14B